MGAHKLTVENTYDNFCSLDPVSHLQLRPGCALDPNPRYESIMRDRRIRQHQAFVLAYIVLTPSFWGRVPTAIVEPEKFSQCQRPKACLILKDEFR
jgi:hypothetical protein